MTDYVIYGVFHKSWNKDLRHKPIRISWNVRTHRIRVWYIYLYCFDLRINAGFFGHTSRFPHIQVSFLYIQVSCLYIISNNNHYLHLLRAPRWSRAISRGGTLVLRIIQLTLLKHVLAHFAVEVVEISCLMALAPTLGIANATPLVPNNFQYLKQWQWCREGSITGFAGLAFPSGDVRAERSGPNFYAIRTTLVMDSYHPRSAPALCPGSTFPVQMCSGSPFGTTLHFLLKIFCIALQLPSAPIVLPASMAFADLEASPIHKEIMDANPRFSTSFDLSEVLLSWPEVLGICCFSFFSPPE